MGLSHKIQFSVKYNAVGNCLKSPRLHGRRIGDRSTYSCWVLSTQVYAATNPWFNPLARTIKASNFIGLPYKIQSIVQQWMLSGCCYCWWWWWWKKVPDSKWMFTIQYLDNITFKLTCSCSFLFVNAASIQVRFLAWPCVIQLRTNPELFKVIFVTQEYRKLLLWRTCIIR